VGEAAGMRPGATTLEAVCAEIVVGDVAVEYLIGGDEDGVAVAEDAPLARIG